MNCRYSIFMRLQIEQQLDNKQKINSILPENAFDAESHTLALKIYLIAPFLNANKVLCDLSLVKPGNH